MRNVKKWIATVLTLAMVLAIALTTTAFAAVSDTGYTDVDANDWYAEAVVYCRENQLMSGTGTAAFSPNSTMTRAMLATVLWRMADEPVVNYLMQFSDVAGNDWYTEAVRWAASEQIMGGYGNGLFGTNDPVSREQIATILWRYEGSPEAGASAGFADDADISDYAVSAVAWARDNGVINGMPGNRFAPQNSATRAEVATILMNYTQKDQPAPSPEPTPDPEPSGSARILVAYFSGTGTTRGVAENIVTALGSDAAVLHEILPEQPYTAADLDYTNSNSRAVTEQHDPSARPAISNSVSNMEQYDVVFLGYPIWNNDAPRIIYTFLESENLNGKTIIPFCTSGGSGIANSVSNIRGLASGATWTDGRRCYSSDTVSTLPPPHQQRELCEMVSGTETLLHTRIWKGDISHGDDYQEKKQILRCLLCCGREWGKAAEMGELRFQRRREKAQGRDRAPAGYQHIHSSLRPDAFRSVRSVRYHLRRQYLGTLYLRGPQVADRQLHPAPDWGQKAG